MRHQYSFILKNKIKSYEDCPCLGADRAYSSSGCGLRECRAFQLADEEFVICKCIGDNGEKVAEVGEGFCPLQVKSGH